MDMQSLNLLKDTTITDQEVIKVIDFEYAGFNPRAMDMANTFCEHCDMNNIQADYPKEYPSDAVQNQFVQSYIRNSPNVPAQVQQHVNAQHMSHMYWTFFGVPKRRNESAW